MNINEKQMNLFEMMYEKYKITKPIRLIELFGGIGSQAKALKNLKVNFQHYKLVEFDKFPVASYNAIHGTNFSTMDITKIHAKDLEITERERWEYIMTYSFPCQDLSLAGKGRGMKKGSGTRSGLLWEVERLLNECGENLPQILLMENVPQVIGEKNLEDFRDWIYFLETKGYSNYYQILNAKDYGIPQNRQRCFMISILGKVYYEFPEKIPLKLKLKDMLEDEVDEKYYLSSKQLEYILDLNNVARSSGRDIDDRVVNPNIAKTISCRGAEGQRADVTNFVIDKEEKEIKVKDLKLKIKNATKKGYLLAEEGDGIDISARMKTHRGTVQKDIIQTIKTQLDVGVVVKSNLKQELCDKLIENGLVKEGDIIRHSYTHNRLDNGIENMRRTESKDKIAPTLDTRCDCLGVVVSACQIQPKDRDYNKHNKPREEHIEERKDDLANAILTNDIKNMVTLKRGYSCEVKQEQKETGHVDVIGNYSKSNFCQTSIVGKNGLAPTVTENHGQVTAICLQQPNDKTTLRIRKLTPKECWRLMGFSDEDFEKASKVNSNAQLYKQAGNSIVVNVLMAIFKELL